MQYKKVLLLLLLLLLLLKTFYPRVDYGTVWLAWQVKLCDPSLTRVSLSASEVSYSS